jgi:hypothetical protein
MKVPPVNSSPRTAFVAIAAVLLIALIGACSSSNKDDDSTITIPVGTPSTTARPTITPVPTATSTPGPTATPSPTSTPAPTPTPTATPIPPESLAAEMGRLFAEKNIDFSTLFLLSVGADQWPTTALGCPEPGTYHDNADAPYQGLVYVISNGDLTWEYHSNADDSVVVRCSEITPSNATLINLAREANLEEASKLTLMRRNFSTGEFEVRREMTPDDMARVVDIFDQVSGISYAPLCTTIFRLDFVTGRGTSEVEFICEDNYKAFDLYWNGLHGFAPILGDIIGPYLTGDSIPLLPTATQ